MDKVTRKVYCYDITAAKGLKEIMEGYYSAYNTIINSGEDLQKSKLIYENSKDNLKYYLDINRKVDVENEDKTSATKVDCYYECILYKLRETDFPYLFDLKTGDKDKIQARLTQALMEQTHFIIIPQLNLIISEYNHLGPNIYKLMSIIDNTLGFPYSCSLNINHIYNGKTIDKIRNLKGIKSMTFKAGHQGLRTLSSIMEVGFLDVKNGTFDNDSELEFEITIKGKGRKKEIKKQNNGEENGLKQCVEKLYRYIDGSKKKEIDADISKAKIKEFDGDSSLPIDLLEEHLVSDIIVSKLDDKFKYLNSKDMFEELFKIYNSNKFDLSKYQKLSIKTLSYFKKIKIKDAEQVVEMQKLESATDSTK
ncbi:hypothetical protein [Clostridium magnum]|uniref:hypothetical protein n=1 Tax=Clostridium magnum TaxID=33954 RepID=UPI0009230EAF|nr:hypothetical protein [Clostridium magnum]SHJ13441.1 hypothetical protein SAMN02745944_05415 [Clostridium magnum DSM 2767]